MRHKWRKLSDVAEVNPRRPVILRSDDELTSFVPMASVDAVEGVIATPELKPYSKVQKGFTYFQNNDVIFAKITPCMQNGKHALVLDMIDGFGFGSTEFHVIRAGKEVCPEWIHFFLRRKETLDAAVKTFKGAVGQQRVPTDFLENIVLPCPLVEDQRRIAVQLKAQLAEVEKARKAAKLQLSEITKLCNSIIFDSLKKGMPSPHLLSDVLIEVKKGIGESWASFPVLGATRAGLAPAKEPPGKYPYKYKPVVPGTVFYNPMRILIGSIAFVDDGGESGITSPDYVVLRGKEGVVDSRWFYYWLRSPLGEQCITSLARGAVRERMLFKRLAKGVVELPDFNVQQNASVALAELKPMCEAIKKQLKEIDLLPQKILSEAFGDGNAN